MQQQQTKLFYAVGRITYADGASFMVSTMFMGAIKDGVIGSTLYRFAVEQILQERAQPGEDCRVSIVSIQPFDLVKKAMSVIRFFIAGQEEGSAQQTVFPWSINSPLDFQFCLDSLIMQVGYPVVILGWSNHGEPTPVKIDA